MKTTRLASLPVRSRLRALVGCAVALACFALAPGTTVHSEDPAGPLRITWKQRLLTITGGTLPDKVEVWYIEAYCRPGSADRDWGQTVIRHKSRLVEADDGGRRIVLEDRLEDGVVVRHVLTTGADYVDFDIRAHNPTDRPSPVDWAQPCVRVDRFTGTTRRDARALVPAYVRQSFLFLEGRLTMMPTHPWATKARYTPGQVYRLPGINPDDVNPRPLSSLIPSHPLVGCFSADRQHMLAIAFVPCQEIFQGVIACLHSDFRIGGLAPGQTKKIHGKIYVLEKADGGQLVRRFQRDFPSWKAER